MTTTFADGFSISLDFGGQRHLRNKGILIPAAWWITKERKEKLELLGVEPPKPIEGHVLLATSEPHIAIDEQVAQELMLKPTGKTRKVYGVGEPDIVQYYSAQLMLPVIPVGQKRVPVAKFALGIPIEAWAIPTLQLSYKEFEQVDHKGAPLKVIGMLGRTFLQFATFTYNGLTGTVEIHIDHSAMYPKED